MKIIMRRLFPLLFLLAFTQVFAAASDDAVSPAAIVRELNLARQNPARYAAFAEAMRSEYNGRYLVLPGGTRLFTKEGSRSIDEAIRFLRAAAPMQPLAYSPGMSHGAADHCADQAAGGFSHTGRDGSNPAARMNRYGTWGLGWGENVSYGKTSARDIVLALIIDDGLRARKHRKNIFNPKFNFVGAAFGPHARFGSVCTMDFAGAYIERDDRSRVARF